MSSAPSSVEPFTTSAHLPEWRAVMVTVSPPVPSTTPVAVSMVICGCQSMARDVFDGNLSGSHT